MYEVGVVNSIDVQDGVVWVLFEQFNDAVLRMDLLESAGKLNVGDQVACLVKDVRGCCLGRFWYDGNRPDWS